MVLAEDCNSYSCCRVRFTGGLFSMTPAQQRRFEPLIAAARGSRSS